MPAATATVADSAENATNFETMRTAEAAAFLSLTPATLNCWRCLNKGPRFVKAGRAVVYRKSDLIAWLNARVKETAESR